MSFLTAKELEQLRSDLNALLPDTCRIERAVYGNTNGYVGETWGTAVTSAVCRVDPDTTRRREMEVAEREAGVAHYILTLKYDENIKDGDRIYYNSAYYNLIELHEAHSSRGVRRGRIGIVRGE